MRNPRITEGKGWGAYREKRRVEILGLIEKGYNIREIGEQLGISGQGVHYYIRMFGLKKRLRDAKEERAYIKFIKDRQSRLKNRGLLALFFCQFFF